MLRKAKHGRCVLLHSRPVLQAPWTQPDLHAIAFPMLCQFSSKPAGVGTNH
jgi:hypothetical protein